MWITGVRGSVVYTIPKRPLDPKWSNGDLQTALGYCVIGQHLGWSDHHAFQVAEAFVMLKKYEGIRWGNEQLKEDMKTIKKIMNPLETTLIQEELERKELYEEKGQ